MLEQKVAILSRIPFFAGLAASEIQAVAERAIEKRYDAAATLFHEGEACQGMFVIAQGQVKICRTSPSGREMTIAVETAPSTVAELPLFDGGPYPASAVAIGEVTVLVIEKREFFALCRQYPDVTLRILAVVGKRLRHLVQTIESVTFGSIRQRLARLLLELDGQALTHQELASRLGTVREVVSRNLSRFQVEALIATEGRRIRLVDRAGLEREAETEL